MKKSSLDLGRWTSSYAGRGESSKTKSALSTLLLHTRQFAKALDMALSSCPRYEQAKRTRILHLNDMGLTSIPSPVLSLTMLTRVDLSYNNLEVLTPDIHQLSNLENLWLNGNPLKAIPSELQHCRKLKVMDLRDTLVESIPREIGRLKNLFTIDLRGTPLCDELDPFKGSTEELLSYLDVKDRRTNIALEVRVRRAKRRADNGAFTGLSKSKADSSVRNVAAANSSIVSCTSLCSSLVAIAFSLQMEDNLLSAKYLETADMVEGGIVVNALVKAVCAQFPDMDELKNCARNADRLFPQRYASPVELRALFHTNPSDGPAAKRKKWRATATKIADKEAVKLKVSYIKLRRENEMVKLSADMELKIR